MTEASDWCGHIVLDVDARELGRVDEIYLDLSTGGFEWMLVHAGPSGSRARLVPLAGARANAECVLVNVSKAQVVGAPILEPASDLPQAEERRLFEHYGLLYDLDRPAGMDRRSVQMRAPMTVGS